MAQRGIAFLMYHELEIPGRPLCQFDAGYSRYVVRNADFRSQMRWLQQTARRAMSVGEALAIRATNGEERPGVVVTFDDGCESDLISAAPTLREASYNATFYITIAFLGQRGYMNLAQLSELSTLGFEIGCHSMTHAYLTDLDERGLAREIVGAKAQLEDILGKPVEHFSCPGGRWDARVTQVARTAGYRSVVNSRVQVNPPTTDTFALGRIAVLRQTALPAFQEICRGEGLWKIQLRDRARDAAKQILGNSLYDRSRALLLR
jgi:peptidoglycan/xylan/chitin deacetylase (PgdA/CDA1 family)